MQFSLIQTERKVLYILPIVCVEVESVEVNRPINVDDDVSSSLNPVEIRLIIIKDCVQYLNSLKIKQKWLECISLSIMQKIFGKELNFNRLFLEFFKQ